MGILNLTPDSFSDGGRYTGVDAGLRRAEVMVRQGADIIDIGGESTRPGADPVDADEEIRRTAPVVRAITRELAVPVSIDTGKAAVARAALDAGAVMVNDVTGLRGDADMAAVVREYGVEVVVMHMQGTPRTMQKNPTYDDVVEDIRAFFRQRLDFCRKAGIDGDKVILDPGIGFGKTLEHNLAILANIRAFKELGRPVLIGHSRKSFLGALLGIETGDRDCATAMVSALCAHGGADYLRVHDVELTRQARALAAEFTGRARG
jgi:dihydropteroate synthase